MRSTRRTYHAEPYGGRTLIVAASRTASRIFHPKRGFPALVPNLEAVIVEGDHADVFKDMDPAAPGQLARAISSFLEPCA
jgi:thioesterase domain-containing protein